MPKGIPGSQVKYICDICGWNTSNKSKYEEHSRRDRKKPCTPGRHYRGKRTTEQVIEDFKKTHGNRYLYDKFKYEDGKDALATITCRCHGDFTMSPNNHQRGQNCPDCANIHRSRTKINRSKTKIIDKFINVHGDKYDYSQVVYKKGRSKVTIVCPSHGPFQQTPESHLSGYGCLKCGNERCANSKRNTQDEMIARFKERWGSEYGYSYDKYIYIDYNDTPGIMTCPKHGDFLQTASNHLDKRNITGCFHCGNKLAAAAHSDTLDSFLQKATSKHGDKFDYSMVEYVSSTIPVKIICPKHSVQIQQPYYHINGEYGCVMCSNELAGEIQRIPKEIFLKKCQERFRDRFDYSDCGYYKMTAKIKPRCKKHDKVFHILPHGHLRADNGGCSSCSIHGASKKQLEWLEYEQGKIEYHIQHIGSENGEYKIPDVGKVDGFCYETNTVYEFHGIFWHGHPDFYDQNEVHNVDKNKTYGQKYEETLTRDERIRNLGYNLVTMWEHEWDSKNPSD